MDFMCIDNHKSNIKTRWELNLNGCYMDILRLAVKQHQYFKDSLL